MGVGLPDLAPLKVARLYLGQVLLDHSATALIDPEEQLGDEPVSFGVAFAGIPIMDEALDELAQRGHLGGQGGGAREANVVEGLHDLEG